MDTIVFNEFKEIVKYYDDLSNTYYFTREPHGKGLRLNIELNFDFKKFESGVKIVVGNIKCRNIECGDIECREIIADDIVARNLDANSRVIANVINIVGDLDAMKVQSSSFINVGGNINVTLDIKAVEYIRGYNITAGGTILAKAIDAWSIEAGNIIAKVENLKTAFSTNIANGKLKILCSERSLGYYINHSL